MNDSATNDAQSLVGRTIANVRVEQDAADDDWWVIVFDDGREIHIRRSEQDCGWLWVDPEEH